MDRRLGAVVAAAVVFLAVPARASSPGQPAADRGAAAYRAGHFSEAREAFAEAVRRDPGHVAAWEGLGWAEYRLGHGAAAVRIWRRVLLLEPGRTSVLDAIASLEARQQLEARREREARRESDASTAREPARDAAAARRASAMGDSALRDRDFAAAERAYRSALREQPGDPRLLTKLGVVLRREGRVADAAAAWTGAAASERAPAEALRFLARAQVELGDRDAARALYDRADARTPSGDAPARLDLADVAFALGDGRRAERTLSALFTAGRREDWATPAARLFVKRAAIDDGIAFFGGDGVPRDLPGRSRALAMLYKARAADAYRARKFGDAARSLELALQLQPDDERALRDLALTYRDAARPEDAERTWRRYAEAFPRATEPHDLLARRSLEAGAFEPALAEARASLAAGPARREPLVSELRSLLGLSLVREARAAAARLAARFPRDVQIQTLYGLALTKARSPGAAAVQWRRVLDLDPGSATAAQNWVRALYEAGDADEAVRQARSLAARPDVPTAVLDLLAEDAVARADLPEAVVWYRALTRRDPRQVRHWRSLSDALDPLGRFDEQIAMAREAVGLMPDRLELRLDLTKALANAGRYDEAIAEDRRILADYPDSRAAGTGIVKMLLNSGQPDAALEALSRTPASFYNPYDRTITEGKIRSQTGDFGGATRLFRSVAAPPPDVRYVPILLYHGVVEQARSGQISVAALDAQLAALAAKGYRGITMSELVRMLRGELSFPERPILITFDDARTDSFELGDPVLRKHGFKATMFVPTAEVGRDDAFHVGWDTLERYQRTGRWELQAHGHEAHRPIAIDPEGHTGEFLVYRKWNAAQRRLETTAEYVDRIERDYAACRRALETRFPGQEVVAYAYPLDQIGQAVPRDRDAVPFANETVARRHFRFGMTQDESGYNELHVGGDDPFLLRRFEVPRTWTGQQLVAHLARSEPARVARVELARAALAEQRPAAARRIISSLDHEEPAVAADLEPILAQIAWNEDRPREVALHLAAAPTGSPDSPGPTSPSAALANRAAWRNRPNVRLDSSLFDDSDGRSVLNVGTALRLPPPGPLDLELRAGALRIGDRGQRVLDGPEVAARAHAAAGRHLDLSGWGRYRELSGAPSSLNGGGEARVRWEQHTFSLAWGREDIETVAAEVKGLRATTVAGAYALESPRWDGEARIDRVTSDDANARIDFHGVLLRMFGDENRVGVGASVGWEDSRFASPDYYAPRQLALAFGRVRYARSWSDSSSVALDLGLGGAHDVVHALRPSGLARVRFSRWWGRRQSWGTTFSVDGRVVPGYTSLDALLAIEARF